MRQIMPHRNNIAMRRTKRKRYFGVIERGARKWGRFQRATGALEGTSLLRRCDIIILNNAL